VSKPKNRKRTRNWVKYARIYILSFELCILLSITIFVCHRIHNMVVTRRSQKRGSSEQVG
jgi:hypothetical protein